MELFTDEVAREYEDFAAYADDSPTFQHWARQVAVDPEVLDWLGRLPQVKRQANLVFAAARWHGVPAPGAYEALREALLGDDGTVRATILSRRTQTNEVGRLATLVPWFAGLARLEGGRPLALLEAGASAGLCLHPDRWSYAWSTDDGVVEAGTGPRLGCRVTGRMDPVVVPSVAWRGGIDLNPLDVADDDATDWLETLVWPEQDERRARLRTAVAIARQDPPRLVAGDLLDLLPSLVGEAAEHGPVVVFHSAVAVYLVPDDRVRFEELMTGLVGSGSCHWVSNEAKQVLPGVTATGPAVPEDLGTFVLGVDGRAVAWTHGHGASMRLL